MGAENDGWALLLTEYVIHIAMYHKEKANVYERKGNAIYHTLNDEVCQVRFTDEKMAAVRYSRERGPAHLDKGEYRSMDYGFHWHLKPQKERECALTPYAMALEAWQDNSNGNAWYFLRAFCARASIT